jgi:hypothetical protein
VAGAIWQAVSLARYQDIQANDRLNAPDCTQALRHLITACAAAFACASRRKDAHDIAMMLTER